MHEDAMRHRLESELGGCVSAIPKQCRALRLRLRRRRHYRAAGLTFEAEWMRREALVFINRLRHKHERIAEIRTELKAVMEHGDA